MVLYLTYPGGEEPLMHNIPTLEIFDPNLFRVLQQFGFHKQELLSHSADNQGDLLEIFFVVVGKISRWELHLCILSGSESQSVK